MPQLLRVLTMATCRHQEAHSTRRHLINRHQDTGTISDRNTISLHLPFIQVNGCISSLCHSKIDIKASMAKLHRHFRKAACRPRILLVPNSSSSSTIRVTIRVTTRMLIAARRMTSYRAIDERQVALVTWRPTMPFMGRAGIHHQPQYLRHDHRHEGSI